MDVQGISVPISWAIAQYRATVTALAGRLQGVARSMRVPHDPPEVTQYFRAIGIGRNIDAYA